jgi:hypothetical protein
MQVSGGCRFHEVGGYVHTRIFHAPTSPFVARCGATTNPHTLGKSRKMAPKIPLEAVGIVWDSARLYTPEHLTNPRVKISFPG